MKGVDELGKQEGAHGFVLEKLWSKNYDALRSRVHDFDHTMRLD